MNPHEVNGRPVECRDVFGNWRKAVARSNVEGTHRKGPQGQTFRIHDFPVVWVEFNGRPGPVPWPADDIREATR